MRDRVYLATFAPAFDGAFVPYSVGCLQAYAETRDAIRQRYEFAPLLAERWPIHDTVDAIREPAVLGLSCYIWSHEYSLEIARRVKQRFPECTVILGGPDIPNGVETYLRDHPFVDFVVHGEGEEAFAAILERRLTDGDDRAIVGVSERRADGTIHRADCSAKVMDLRSLPSPYAARLFDSFVARYEGRWFALAETNRGCPFECSFCYWGAATASKVRAFPEERTLAELEYCASHRAAAIYSCDANFGMFESDVRYARRLSALRATTGYPLRFRPAYSKIPTERVFEIARTLHDAQLEKGVTISLQSTAPSALSRSNRRALDFQLFRDWLRRFASERIPTYTELILGLPGETAQTFREGISRVLEHGQHDGLIVNLCLALPNTELARSDGANGVAKAARLRLDLAYSQPSASDVTEYCSVVTETDTMSHDEWVESAVLAYAVQGLHCTGLTKLPAMFVATKCGIPYDQFYSRLLSRNAPPLIAQAIQETRDTFDSWLHGGRLSIAKSPFTDILWPPEDTLFLTLVGQKGRLLEELREWLQAELDLSATLSSDLVAFTEALVVGPSESAEVAVRTNWDWWSFLQNPEQPLTEQRFVRTLATRPWSSLEEYALEIVRYGRKAGLLQRHLVSAGDELIRSEGCDNGRFMHGNPQAS